MTHFFGDHGAPGHLSFIFTIDRVKFLTESWPYGLRIYLLYDFIRKFRTKVEFLGLAVIEVNA